MDPHENQQDNVAQARQKALKKISRKWEELRLFSALITEIKEFIKGNFSHFSDAEKDELFNTITTSDIKTQDYFVLEQVKKSLEELANDPDKPAANEVNNEILMKMDMATGILASRDYERFIRKSFPHFSEQEKDELYGIIDDFVARLNQHNIWEHLSEPEKPCKKSVTSVVKNMQSRLRDHLSKKEAASWTYDQVKAAIFSVYEEYAVNHTQPRAAEPTGEALLENQPEQQAVSHGSPIKHFRDDSRPCSSDEFPKKSPTHKP
jgi:succinate dehydrogenase flavin-adding protein (antitoxin of CptAB toxin-antitoxin module)